MGIRRKDQVRRVESRIEKISEGNVGKITEELTIENKKNLCGRLRRLTGYLTRFHDALSYDSFKEKGYPIGSEKIESAHKSVPQKRLKIPGATWHPDSVDPVPALRMLRADEWREDFWMQRTDKLSAA